MVTVAFRGGPYQLAVYQASGTSGVSDGYLVVIDPDCSLVTVCRVGVDNVARFWEYWTECAKHDKVKTVLDTLRRFGLLWMGRVLGTASVLFWGCDVCVLCYLDVQDPTRRVHSADSWGQDLLQQHVRTGALH
jgi:hypothetical protein